MIYHRSFTLQLNCKQCSTYKTLESLITMKKLSLFFVILPIVFTIDLYSQDHYEIGKEKLNQQDFSTAISEFTKAIQTDSINEDAYLCRGRAKAMLKEFDGAILDYNKAMQVNPNDEQPYLERGMLYGMRKESQSAITDFTKAIELNPKRYDGYLFRGFERLKLNQNRSACKDFKKGRTLVTGEEQKNTLDNLIEKYCQ